MTFQSGVKMTKKKKKTVNAVNYCSFKLLSGGDWSCSKNINLVLFHISCLQCAHMYSQSPRFSVMAHVENELHMRLVLWDR